MRAALGGRGGDAARPTSQRPPPMTNARVMDLGPFARAAVQQWSRSWWLVALRGAAAILFGICAFAWPGVTLVVLALLWGCYAVVDGVMALVAGWRVRDTGAPVWPLALLGLLGVLAGLTAIVSPGVATLALVTLVGAWAIVTGVLEIVAAIRLRKAIEGEWMLALAGAASVALGLFVLARPGVGAIALAWWIGAYAIAFGVLLVVLGFKLRALGR
jgi:uncharacterized membrane protein HdeD (DUF308 family)